MRVGSVKHFFQGERQTPIHYTHSATPTTKMEVLASVVKYVHSSYSHFLTDTHVQLYLYKRITPVLTYRDGYV